VLSKGQSKANITAGSTAPHGTASSGSSDPKPQKEYVPSNDKENPFEAPLDHIREEERPYQHLSDITHFDVNTLKKLHKIFQEISATTIDDGIIDAAVNQFML
jgi:hypothetical protein